MGWEDSFTPENQAPTGSAAPSWQDSFVPESNTNNKVPPPYLPDRGLGQDLTAQAVQGATFGLGDEGMAALAAGLSAKDRLGTQEGVTLENLGKDYGSALDYERGAEKKFQQEHPAEALGANLVGGLITGGAGASTKAGTSIANSLRTGSAGARLAKNAALGAVSGGAYGFGSGEGDAENRLKGAGEGAIAGGVTGAAIPAAGAAAGAVKDLVFPQASESLIPLAQKAVENYGIPLSRSQVGDSKVAKALASTVEEVPFSGAASFRDKQQNAFNKAVSNTIGEDSDKITPDVVNAAYKNIGKKFDSILAGKQIKVSDDALNQLAAIEDDASRSITGDHFKIVKNNINKFLNDISPDGTISGEKIGSLRSNLSKTLRGTKNDASLYLHDINDAVMDASVDGFPGDREILNQARRQYKNLKTIEDLAEKSTDGNISPSLLLGRVRQKFSDFSRGGGGELGDLARIGHAFLRDSIPNSGTARRLMSYGALGGAGALTSFPLVAKGVASARGFNALNTSQKLVKNALNPKAASQAVGQLAGAGKAAIAGGAAEQARKEPLSITIHPSDRPGYKQPFFKGGVVRKSPPKTRQTYHPGSVGGRR